MREFEELTTTAGVAAWVPADAYADLIFGASVCYGQLSGVITAIDYDLKACQGDTIQVRYAPARTAQGPKDPCECLSATSSTLGTYSITVEAYGDYDLMCAFSLFTACGPVKDRILDEMAKGLAKKRDEVIWTQITQFQAAPAYISTTSVTCGARWTRDASYCCAYAYDLYNSIVSVQKEMEAAAYNPTHVILNPEVAKWLYFKDVAYPPGNLVKYDDKGGILSINGLKVIECCNATTCNTTSGATMAVVIDSSRAVGEAWGRRPKFYEFYEVDCDRYKETIWMYWGASELDTGAIGHIRNP